MEMQPLFLDRPIEFGGADKLAGMLTKLSDNTDMWPQQILDAAYKQLPYLSAYQVDIALDKIDEEKGFAFGSIVVQPRTDLMAGEPGREQIIRVHIPVVVKNQMLSPLDVFMSGKDFRFLTEEKMRQVMFRASIFDAARDQPPDASLINELYPPLRSSEGGFGGSGIKLGSLVPLLPQLHGTVLMRHKEKFLKEAQDRSVLTAYANAPEGVRAAFESAMNLTLSDPVKTAGITWDRIVPNVVQLRKLDNGHCLLKWANTEMFEPMEEEIPPELAEELLGDQDLIERMESDGTITVSPEAAQKETLDVGDITNLNQFGLWTVQDTTGNDLTGWGFPSLLSMDLQPMPLILFSNGSQYSIQDQIAGKLIGKSTEIPRGIPRGYGCLYYVDHGTAKAFVPTTVTTTYRDPNGQVMYVCQDDFGGNFMFTFAEGLKSVTKTGESEYAVPTNFCWLPLKAKVELVQEPALFSKTAAKIWNGLVEIVGDADVFSFRGAPLAKLGSRQKQFLDRNQAEFLGVALGVHPNFIKEALNRSSKGELVSIPVFKEIKGADVKLAEAKEKVAAVLQDLDVPLRAYCLVKEASILDDAMTADKILGLGFLNAENVASFVEMLPSLEDASSKLAELLIAVRVGLKDVPEVAVERMLAALEDVIRGLRSLQQKEITFA